MVETPVSLGYRMPAEWEPHSSTWLTWPHNPETWPGQDMQKVEEEFLAIIRHLALDEPVHILVNGEEIRRKVKTILKKYCVNIYNTLRLHVNLFMNMLSIVSYIDNSFDEAEKIENLLLDQKVLRDLNSE